MEKIDFVVLWVDGGDPEWQKSKREYQPESSRMIDDGEVRYRDWDNMRYWFRGVEKFAPWVHKVYFVTCGQVPEWLNLDCEKLVFVKHSDYMPEEYLPTFSSHPIELNLHRIKGLSENFVYFNDDLFLTAPVKPSDFFRNGKPVHLPLLHAILPLAEANGEIMSHIYVNMVTAINRNFNAKKSIAANRRKWFNPFELGWKNVIMNAFNSRHLEFVGFGSDHLPVAIKKSVMKEVWEKEYELLDGTSRRKFRNSQDVSQFLFRYWNLASGNFAAVNTAKIGRRYAASFHNEAITSAIRSQKHKMICVNDMNEPCTAAQFEQIKNEVNSAFQEILPERSIFEKQEMNDL